jgi:hypothetical protein
VGPQALEGTYSVRLTKGKEVLTAPLVLLADPDSPFSAADRQARYDTSLKLFGMLEDMAFTVDRIREVREAARSRATSVGAEALKLRLETFASQAEEARALFVPVKEVEGITGEERLREKLTELYGSVTGYRGQPSRSQLDRMEALRKDISVAAQGFETLLARELPGLNGGLAKAGLAPVAPLDRGTWEARTAKP